MSFDTVSMIVFVLFFIGQAACWYEAGRSKGLSDGLANAMDIVKRMLE